MHRHRLEIVSLVLVVGILVAGCTVPATGAESAPAQTPPAAAEEGPAALPNPASVHCEENGGRLEIRTSKDGSQAGYCVFEDGSECDEWAYYHGTCAPGQSLQALPTAKPDESVAGAASDVVEGWVGRLVSLPAGAQFDDCFENPNGERYGIDAPDPDVKGRIDALRDSDRLVGLWGRLSTDVPDVNGRQIVVERIVEEGTEPVDGWVGSIVSTAPGAQFDDFIAVSDPAEGRYGFAAFGIASLDEGIREEIAGLRDTETPVRVWGVLRRLVPDAYGFQIEVERLQAEPAG